MTKEEDQIPAFCAITDKVKYRNKIYYVFETIDSPQHNISAIARPLSPKINDKETVVLRPIHFARGEASIISEEESDISEKDNEN